MIILSFSFQRSLGGNDGEGECGKRPAGYHKTDLDGSIFILATEPILKHFENVAPDLPEEEREDCSL